MNKGTKGIIIILAVTIPAIIVAVALTSGKSEAPTASESSSSSTSNQEQASSEAAAPVDATDSKSVNVEIKDYAFNPATITVKVGTKVTWTNQDSMRHDVVATNPSSDAPSSELFGRGESYSFTFNKTGTYDYYCTPHPYMKGKVIVTE